MISQHHHHPHNRYRQHCTIIIAMIVTTTITMTIIIPLSLNSQRKPRCIYRLLWCQAYLVGFFLTVVLFVCHPVVVNVIVTFVPKAVLIARV